MAVAHVDTQLNQPQTRRISLLGVVSILLLGLCATPALIEFFTPNVAAPEFTQKTDAAEIVAAIKAMPDNEVEAMRQRQIADFIHAPLESTALDPLLLVDDVKGSREETARWTTVMADRTLRDVPMQLSAIQYALARNDYAEVFHRYDALIRTQVSARPQFYAAIDQILAIPAARDDFAKTLGSDPPWRTEFLNDAFRGKLPAESSYRLLTLLKVTPNPPQQGELAELINRLLSEKLDDTAYFVWLDFLSDADIKKAHALFDGGFDLPPRNLFFDWTMNQQSGAEARIIERAVGSSDRVLRVQFTSFQGFYGSVQQFTRLTPGSYVLRGQEKAEDMHATAGLSWILRCRNNTELGRSKPTLVETDWSEFQFSFEVPAEGCPTQFLRLESASRLVADQNVSGTLYFDDMAILASDGSQPPKN